jgi:hypothetical protein
MSPDPILVNIEDADDIDAKLATAEMEHARWGEIARRLRALAGVDDDERRANSRPAKKAEAILGGMTLQDLVIDVINDSDEALSPKDVAAILARNGVVVADQSVANALWHAAKETERISRIGRGSYASLNSTAALRHQIEQLDEVAHRD